MKWVALGLLSAMATLGPISSHAATDRPLLLPLIQEPGTLDSQRSASDTDFDILRDLFEGLVTRGADNTPEPGAALRWETSADGLVWTFHLRPDEKWSDGSPLTAEDFVYSFRREVDPETASPFAETFTPFTGAAAIIAGRQKPSTLGVVAVDPLTLRITLARPTPWLLALLGNYSGLPVPRKAIEKYGDTWTRPGNLIGNGAYRLSAWVPYGGVTVVRNRNYHDAGAVRIQMVRRVPVGDPNTGIRMWEDGELDVVRVPYDQIARMRASHADAMHIIPWVATYYLVVNLDRPELQDPRIRQALTLAIDRDAIVSRVQHGGAVPAFGLIPPNGFPGYDPPQPGWTKLSMSARIAEARRLMTEARGADAPPLKLAVRMNKDEPLERVVLAIGAMWKSALGVEVTLDTSEGRIFLADLLQRNYQIAFDGWDADYLDPWNFLETFLSDMRMNFAHYHNATYDDLLDRSRTAPDPAARMQLLEQAEATMLEDQPIMPVEFRLLPTLVNPHLGGWSVNPIDIHLSRDLYWTE